MDNLTFIMHLNELKMKLKIHKMLRKSNKRTLELEFWTLNVKEEKLINIKEFKRELKELSIEDFLPLFTKIK